MAKVLFDTPADIRTYITQPLIDVIMSAERERKAKYLSKYEKRRAAFMPCSSMLNHMMDGMMGRGLFSEETRLADDLARKWEKPYSVVMVG